MQCKIKTTDINENIMELNNVKNTFCFVSVEDLKSFAQALLQGQEELMRRRADDKYVTVAEAAKTLKVTRASIYNWVRKGKIKPLKAGNRTLFSKADIEAIVKKKL